VIEEVAIPVTELEQGEREKNDSRAELQIKENSVKHGELCASSWHWDRVQDFDHKGGLKNNVRARLFVGKCRKINS